MKTKLILLLIATIISFNSIAQIGLTRNKIEDKLDSLNFVIIDSKPNYTTVQTRKKTKIIYAYDQNNICYSTYVFKMGATIDFFNNFALKNNFSPIITKGIGVYKNKEKESLVAVIKQDITKQYYIEVSIESNL